MHFFLLLLAFAADAPSFEARKLQIKKQMAQGDFAQAAAEAQAINRQWPDDIETYQLLAAAHLELGNYDDADRALQWMLDLRIGKADLRGYWLLARFREVTGDLDGAIEAMNLAFARQQEGQKADRQEMLAYLSHLHVAAGKLALAAKILNEANAAAVMEARAELLQAQSKPAEAIVVLRELVSKSVEPRHRYLLAVATGDYTAFEHAPGGANRELALYLAGPGGRPQEALAVATREAARRHDVLTQDALAFCLAANGRTEEARKVMRAVLAVGTVDPTIVGHAAALGLKPE